MALLVKVFLEGDKSVRAVTRHALVRRTGDIAHARMQTVDVLAQGAVDGHGWIALVAAHIETYAGMTAYAAQIVRGVIQEEGVIIGVGAVSRVGQPEVLPHHNAVAVARLIKFLVAGLAYPVAYHVTVHVAVVTHGHVVLAATVVEVIL